MSSPIETEMLYVPDLFSGITIVAGDRGLMAVHFGRCAKDGAAGPVVRETAIQLRQYRNGTRRFFDLPLDLRGTTFQIKVWRALMDIPYGRTKSYKDVALAINCRGFQAIGQANHCNPVPIVVPCHRVIAADGSIGGYGGGVDLKRELLGLESYCGFLRP